MNPENNFNNRIKFKTSQNFHNMVENQKRNPPLGQKQKNKSTLLQKLKNCSNQSELVPSQIQPQMNIQSSYNNPIEVLERRRNQKLKDKQDYERKVVRKNYSFNFSYFVIISPFPYRIGQISVRCKDNHQLKMVKFTER